VKEYLLKAGICSLATGDIVRMNTALERYRDLDPSFMQQREHQLLVDLTQAVSDVFSPNPQLFG
jgi:alpha-soluble NSF attachment protein